MGDEARGNGAFRRLGAPGAATTRTLRIAFLPRPDSGRSSCHPPPAHWTGAKAYYHSAYLASSAQAAYDLSYASQNLGYLINYSAYLQSRISLEESISAQLESRISEIRAEIAAAGQPEVTYPEPDEYNEDYYHEEEHEEGYDD